MSRRKIAARLVEVGRYENFKFEEYAPGQFFVHRIFGYRGVILFPWASKLIDFDEPANRRPNRKVPSSTSTSAKNDDVVRPNYQVLIDQRDHRHVRILKDDVTIFHKDKKSGKGYLTTLVGFSNVAHDDVFPYSSTEPVCLQHESFNICFDTVWEKTWRLSELPALRSWRDHYLPLLEVSSVYRQTTENVRVTAIPFYLGSFLNADKKAKSYMWRCSIRLENFGEQNITLRNRKWEVVDAYGRCDPHVGVGVVGVQPKLSLSKRAFQYSSFVELPCASGYMSGTYTMQRDDGSSFGCQVPKFALESRQDDDDDVES